jgi:hypothetical protein
MAKGRLISKRVKGIQCDCSWNGSKQAGFERFDFCKCKLSGQKGKRGTVYSLPGEYNLGVIFIKAPKPRR